MPHTNRPKKPTSNSKSQPPKRLQVTDTDGWTHITTTKNARRALRPQAQAQAQSRPEHHTPLTPAEAPPQTTLEDLQRRFNAHRERWESSESWRVIRETLRGLLRSDPSEAASASESETGWNPSVVGIVCIGLGSPSGFLRGGWVDRRGVSMYQLAALVSMVDVIREYHPSVTTFAQDPVFNDLDRSLLRALDITVLEHPEGFEKVSDRTFLFCPGAERTHLEQLLPSNPPLLFGGPLEEMESDAVTQFLGSRGSVRVPSFEGNEHAFWKMRLYFLETA